MLLDCGVTHGVQGGPEPPRQPVWKAVPQAALRMVGLSKRQHRWHDYTQERRALLKAAPHVVLRMIGFGTVCQSWGGLLADVPIDPKRAGRQYRDANQGAMMYAFKVSLFADPVHFKREMDEYAQRVRQLEPIAGAEGAFLPGGVEAAREQAYRAAGIPLSDSHQEGLEGLAEALGVAVPWR